jgi:Asp-tRNA(Asn)/Glu-tRNA(Gln) amidotransferase A subunit family amidase
VLETAGLARTDEKSRGALASLLGALERQGVEVVRRTTHPLVDRLEHAIANAEETASAITRWENRWAQRALVDLHPDGVSQRAKAVLAKAEAMTLDDYRAMLIEREQAQAAHRAIAPLADAVITLSCPGPAPLWSGDKPGEPLIARPTGDAIFNYPSSMLFTPAVTVPMLAVDGMPVGVQLMGQPHEDASMVAIARWLAGAVEPIAV